MNIGIFLKQFKRWVSGGTPKVCWSFMTLLAFYWKEQRRTELENSAASFGRNLKKLRVWAGLIHIVVLLQRVASLQSHFASVTQMYLLLKAACHKERDENEKISQNHFVIRQLLEFNCKTASMTKPWFCLYLLPQACKRHGWRNQIRKWAQFWLWKTTGAVQAAAWWRRGSCHSFSVFAMHPP